MTRLVLEASMPRMRSESRTLDTSGLVTTRASSAKCMAIRAPVSMPAGESQTMYSKPMPDRSCSTFSTPSLDSASLSRVCEAASTNRLSHCLSLIRAWFRLASPWITLIRSYTTRRSQPMIKSRLRRPTSKSITAVLWPRSARPEAKLALVVDLPTPPLPDVTTMILAAMRQPPSVRQFLLKSTEALDLETIAFEEHHRRLPRHVGRQRIVRGAEDAGDRQHLRLQAVAVDACLAVAGSAGVGTPAQRRVDVDIAVGQHLGAEADQRAHDQVAPLGMDLLAGAQRLVDHQRRQRLQLHLDDALDDPLDDLR